MRQNKNLDLFEERLPWHGFATDDLTHGVRFLPLAELIKKAMIQFNWKHSIGFLGYDVDSETARFDWEDNPTIPPPNILILNPNNGHAHYLYALEKPVHKYEGASEKALRYLAAVDVAMTETLKADPGFAKLLCKNPFFDRWIVIYPRQEIYNLDELASWVDMERYKDKRRRLPAVGYGRNSTLFETLRIWAYRERRRGKPYLSEELFHLCVLGYAHTINADFDTPLPHSEVRSTAKSVSRWTWRKMSQEGFIQYQSAMSGRAAKKRKVKSLELRKKIIDAVYQCPTLTQEDIAAMMGCTQKTVSLHLKAARKNYTSPVSDKKQKPLPLLCAFQTIKIIGNKTVSYTHLTLPTKRIV